MAEILTTQTSEEFPWWALYTRHQHEHKVADTLQCKGFEVFLPVYESVRRWKDRTKVLSLPLFPGYVFVRGTRGRQLGILTTPGVHMILSRGDEAAAVPEQEIQAIRRVLEGKFAAEPHPYLNCGDRIRVRRGPLEGIEGILVRKKNMFRLVLSVDMLAKSVCVELDARDVDSIQSLPSADEPGHRPPSPLAQFPPVHQPAGWEASKLPQQTSL